MAIAEDRNWEQALREACFPVTLKKVFVDDPGYLAKRYRAVTRANAEPNEQPFAVVTDKYKLISNQDVVDLGHEAFEHLFGLSLRGKISVFNVVLAKRQGSFFADFTTPELNFDVNTPNTGSDKHAFFLRVVNSYNRTQAVRMEVGVCRWICRNGIIFGKQSIQIRAPHHKDKYQLMDEIASQAKPVETAVLQRNVSRAFNLNNHMSVLEGAWQVLDLTIPDPNSKSRVSRTWIDRCTNLISLAGKYENQYGENAFSALQAASEWAQNSAETSPTQRNSYERRCGRMLEILMTEGAWPERNSAADEQVKRIHAWAELYGRPK